MSSFLESSNIVLFKAKVSSAETAGESPCLEDGMEMDEFPGGLLTLY